MESKWKLQAPQITKNQEKWALKKTSKNNTAQNGLLVENELKRGGGVAFAPKTFPKSQKSEIS